jgi:hypothetical protein
MLLQSLNEANTQSNDRRVLHCKKMSFFFNTIAFGTSTDPGHYVEPHDKEGNLGELKVNDRWDKQVEAKIPELVGMLLVKPTSKKDKWLECVTTLSSIF